MHSPVCLSFPTSAVNLDKAERAEGRRERRAKEKDGGGAEDQRAPAAAAGERHQ